MVVAVYWQNVLTLFGSVTLLCRSDRVLQKGYCFLPHQGRRCTHEPRQFLIISAVQTHTHSQIDLWLGLLGHSDRFLFLKKKPNTPKHFTLSTATNPLATLNKVIARSRCWRVLLFCSIYLNFTDVLWKETMSNAEYAMLLVLEFLKVMHTWKLFVSVCYLLCSCVMIIPALHHG